MFSRTNARYALSSLLTLSALAAAPFAAHAQLPTGPINPPNVAVQPYLGSYASPFGYGGFGAFGTTAITPTVTTVNPYQFGFNTGYNFSTGNTSAQNYGYTPGFGPGGLSYQDALNLADLLQQAYERGRAENSNASDAGAANAEEEAAPAATARPYRSPRLADYVARQRVGRNGLNMAWTGQTRGVAQVTFEVYTANNRRLARATVDGSRPRVAFRNVPGASYYNVVLEMTNGTRRTVSSSLR